MRKLLLAAGFVILFAAPAQAQPQIDISCTAVLVNFRTSIQPDSAKVEITSDAGTDTYIPTLSGGGTDVISFPIDGQNGENVSVTVTLIYRGLSNVTSASEILEGCPVPSPSPSPTVSPESSPSPIATADAPTVTPGASPSPEPTEEAVEGIVETSSESVEQPPSSPLPEELAFTGFSQVLGLLILAVSLIGLGLYARGKGYRRAR